jgi:dCMP deaminase
MLGPREDYLCWDDCFMGVAEIMAQRSKDPHTQVGCCLVDRNNHIVGTGYNGFPKHIPNDALPWDRDGESNKYLFVSHAESNAVDNSDRHLLEGARAYVSLFPCNQCAIRLIQNGIVEVIYLSDKYHDTNSCIAARRMFDLAGVKYRQFTPQRDHIEVSFKGTQ